MKQIDDHTLRQILNTLEQTRQRLGQQAYTKTPLDPQLCVQVAQAVASVARTLSTLPSAKELSA